MEDKRIWRLSDPVKSLFLIKDSKEPLEVKVEADRWSFRRTRTILLVWTSSWTLPREQLPEREEMMMIGGRTIGTVAAEIERGGKIMTKNQEHFKRCNLSHLVIHFRFFVE